jgi:succinate-acetate transporter protein
MSPDGLNWGNSAPLALAAFGVTTFMLSMVNVNLISPGEH